MNQIPKHVTASESHIHKPKTLRSAALTTLLLILAATYGAIWIWHPIDKDQEPLQILFPIFIWLFPAVVYALAATVFQVGRWGDPGVKPRDPASFFALAASLYLLMLGVFARQQFKDEHWSYRLGLSAALGACFLILFLAFAYAEFSWQESSARILDPTPAYWPFIGRRWLAIAGYFRAAWLLPTGAGLVLASCFLDGTTSAFVFREGWITSIEEVTGRIKPIQTIKAILGQGSYALGLSLAAGTLVLLLLTRFRPARIKPALLRRVLLALAAFMAVYSALDLAFGWLGLLADDDHPLLWVLFWLWLGLWLVSLAGLVWGSKPSRAVPVHPWLALLVLPGLLFDVAMGPSLFSRDLNLPGLASWVVGLQLLWWGFVQCNHEPV